MTPISKIIGDFMAKLTAAVESRSDGKPAEAPRASHISIADRPEPRTIVRRSRRGDYSQASHDTKMKLERIRKFYPDLMSEVDSGRMTFIEAYNIYCERKRQEKAGEFSPRPNRYADLCEAWNNATADERVKFVEYQKWRGEVPEGFRWVEETG